MIRARKGHDGDGDVEDGVLVDRIGVIGVLSDGDFLRWLIGIVCGGLLGWGRVNCGGGWGPWGLDVSPRIGCVRDLWGGVLLSVVI
jgi:hypothetical protein